MEDKTVNLGEVEAWEQETEDKKSVMDYVKLGWKKAKPYAIGAVLGAGGLLVYAMVAGGDDDSDESTNLLGSLEDDSVTIDTSVPGEVTIRENETETEA